MNGTPTIDNLMTSIRSAVVVAPEKLELILATLLAGGHLLLEDVPGIGKTLAAKTLAKSIHATFRRVQCTPDLLPGDITGGAVFNQRESTFEFVAGPIFANVVLVDEINRATPRTQAALLEAMAEGQVTTDGFTRPLPKPFFLIATQNPIEQAGTFPLPEAQLDRFLVQLNLGYPNFEDEVTILQREEQVSPLESVQAVIELESILALQAMVKKVAVSRPVQEYIVRLVSATRTHPDVVLGVSPRGGVALQQCGQALAYLRGRTFVTPDDVKTAAPFVMAHRLLARDRRAGAAGKLVGQLLDQVAVPVG